VSADEIDMGLLPGLIGYGLRCAQTTVFQHFGQSLAEHSVSPPQFGALVLIEANPGVSQSAVAAALRFDRSTLVQIIDRLEERGLVTREASARDRRSHALMLTDAGAETLQALKRAVQRHEDHMTHDLSADEKALLMDMLGRIDRAGGA
jgi:DNA-binding MarR family transcriptional regulator